MKLMRLRKFLFIFIIFMLGSFGVANVDAASKTYNIKGKYCSSYRYNYTLYKKYAFMGSSSSDPSYQVPIQYSTSPKQIVYCIEKGVALKTGSKSYSDVAKVSDDTKLGNIAKAIAYGKNGTSSVDSCTSERVATSLLVHMISKGYTESGSLKWKTITESEVRKVYTTDNKSTIASNFVKIRNKVLEHDKMPFSSFASITKSTAQSKAKYMEYSSKNNNFTKTVSDSLLSKDWGWTVSEKDDGITSATISGGKLTVTTALKTRGQNLCVKIRKTVATGTLYKSTATNQDTALLYNEGSGYLTTYVCFKTSYISVKKVDAANTSKVLSGTDFDLYTDSSCKTEAKSVNDSNYNVKTTDSNGYAYFYNVEDGKTFYVKEIQSPNNYEVDTENCRKVAVSGRTGFVTFKNAKITSTSVQVFKNDKYTDLGIPNVKIGLYSDASCTTKSTLVSDPVKTTDDTGMVIWKNISTTGLTMPHTLYVMEQKSSIPKGYIQEKENDCKKVQISSSDITDGETTTEVMNSVIIYNIPFGNINILKLDDDSRKPIEGITFKLLDENMKEVKDRNGKVVAPVTTDKNGLAVFKDIFYGTYYIEEVKSNENYKTAEPLLFELNKNTDSIKLADLAAIPYYIADVNMDNVVTKDDLDELTTMLKAEENLIGLEKKKQYSTDVNKDGVIDEHDSAVLQYYLDNKDYIIAQFNGYDFLCGDNKDCQPPIAKLSGVSKVDSLDDATSSNICYVPSVPNPTAEGDEGQEPSGGTTNPEPGGEAGGVTPDEGNDNEGPNGALPTSCHFTSDSVNYLNQYISNNNVTGLNADFDENGKIDQNDVAILELYLSYVKNGKIDLVLDYVESIDKIKEIDSASAAVLRRIGTRDVIPSEEVHASIVVTNIPIDMKISKLDIIEQEELPGAEIVIKDSAGKEFIKFVSTKEVKEFYIPAGEYTLTETIVPEGYNKVTTVLKFKVRNDGNIELIDNNSEMFELVNSNEERDTDLDHLKIYNSPIKKKIIEVPDTGSKIAFISIIAGLSMISVGGYFVYQRYKNGMAN